MGDERRDAPVGGHRGTPADRFRQLADMTDGTFIPPGRVRPGMSRRGGPSGRGGGRGGGRFDDRGFQFALAAAGVLLLLAGVAVSVSSLLGAGPGAMFPNENGTATPTSTPTGDSDRTTAPSPSDSPTPSPSPTASPSPTPSPSPSPTASPSPSPSPTASPSPTGTASSSPTGTATATGTAETSGDGTGTPGPSTPPGLTIIDAEDRDGDGRYSAFDLRIRADTRMPNADAGGRPGDPYFALEIGGERVGQTDQVERVADGRFRLRVPESALEDRNAGPLDVRVILADEDPVSDDRIQTWTLRVPYEPRSED